MSKTDPYAAPDAPDASPGPEKGSRRASDTETGPQAHKDAPSTKKATKRPS